jgi:RNA polymerase sigma-70 factor (ECF subfamily)
MRRDRPIDPDRLMVALMSKPEEPEYDGVERVQAGLRALPPDQARPIVLAVVYGLTAREIAEREGIPVGTAKTRIRRGMARLRVALGVIDG